MRTVLPALLLASVVGSWGCDGDDGSPPTGDDGIPPGGDPLAAWLADGEYLGWRAEPQVHAGGGPHFGDVRTFFSPSLVESMEAGGEIHPVGAASVKELYGESDVVEGWAVMIKIDGSSGGDSWYWWEVHNGTTYADSVGTTVCVNCHATGADYVVSPLP